MAVIVLFKGESSLDYFSMQQYSKLGHKNRLISVMLMPIYTENNTPVWINENFDKDIDYMLSYNYRLIYKDEPLFSANCIEKSQKIFGWLT